MTALSTPARTMAPIRLRSRNSHNSNAIAKPKPIRHSRYAENTPSPICTVPCNDGGAGKRSTVRPHSVCTRSRNTKVKPNVSST